eukprot:15480981-Alexandrium_andersonii.AAC.2
MLKQFWVESLYQDRAPPKGEQVEVNSASSAGNGFQQLSAASRPSCPWGPPGAPGPTRKALPAIWLALFGGGVRGPPPERRGEKLLKAVGSCQTRWQHCSPLVAHPWGAP